MTRFTPAPDVRFASTEDGAMLLNLATGRFFGLNPTAAAIWRQIADGTPPEDIAVALAVGLAVPEKRLLSDVHALMTVLRRHELLVGKEPLE